MGGCVSRAQCSSRAVAFFMLLMSILSTRQAESAVEYTVIDLTIVADPSGQLPERPGEYGLNDNGDVTGLGDLSRPFYFKYHAGPVVNLGDLTGDFGSGGNGYSWGYGINAGGWVVGSTRNAQNHSRPFLWRDDNENGVADPGEMRELAMNPGATEAVAYSINNAGQVVISGNGISRWTDLDGDLVVDANERVILSTSGSYYASGSVNESGSVLYFDQRPRRWTDANNDSLIQSSEIATIPLNLLGGIHSSAQSMNNDGDVTGFYELANGFARGYLWRDVNDNHQVDTGEAVDLGTPPQTNLYPFGINDACDIVGGLAQIGVPRVAVIWDEGNGYRDLNALIDPNLAIHCEQAWQINNTGQIALHGYRTGEEQIERVYLLTPRVQPDLDYDGDVDPHDLVLFEDCVTGPAVGPPATGCEEADFDGDNDVDQDDFGVWQRCLSGSDTPAEQACDD